MKRFIYSLLCAFDIHDWMTPLPWRGHWAKACKRCRHCGLEWPSSISVDEYGELIEQAKRSDDYDRTDSN